MGKGRSKRDGKGGAAARERRTGDAASAAKRAGGAGRSTGHTTPPPRRGDHIELIARGCLLYAGRVLVCTNVKHGYAYLPGGHVEFGESAAEALAREFVEECGLRVRVGDLALVTEGSFATKKRWHHEVNLVFHVEHVGGRGARNSDEAGRSGADADHGSSLREATGGPPPRVVSLEDSIGFEWVDLAAVPDLDIRPESAKAWLAALGHQDGASVEWVSEFAARPLGSA